ncbi:MAG: hypothetical protein KF746_11945 [Chitinophagaceae bacterium]|nr:hypothetical protein [Chitinophagaceae bacterium]
MKLFIVFVLLFTGCNRNIEKVKKSQVQKVDSSTWIIDGEKNIVIAKASNNLWVDLEVHAYSKDSIVVHSDFNNMSNDTFMLYKSLVPDNENSNHLFSVLTSDKLLPLDFIGGASTNKYIQVGSLMTDYILPDIQEKNLIPLPPMSKIELSCNISRRYDFNKFLKQGVTQFELAYFSFFPLIEKGEQVKEIDSLDGKMKFVYYVITTKETHDPDSMRVKFQIPGK